MASKTQQKASLSPKKPVNLSDQYAVKRVLDDTVNEVILAKGYAENFNVSNIKMAIGILSTALALLAQFFPKKSPYNKTVLIVCIISYVLLLGLLQLIVHLKEKNHILFTHPLNGSFTSTGLAVSSKFPRCVDLYTLKIDSSDPKSIAANPPVELTKSVTEWFYKDGTLIEGLFTEDVEKLLAEYTEENRKGK